MKMKVQLLLAALAATCLAQDEPSDDSDFDSEASSVPESEVVPEYEPLYTIMTGVDMVQLVTEEEKWHLKSRGVTFIDITDTPELETIASLNAHNPVFEQPVYPTEVMHTRVVRRLHQLLSKSVMQSNLLIFSSFHNRYYTSEFGQRSQEWLLAQIQHIIATSGAENVTVREFGHAFPQNTLIATIPGQTSSTIVIGAHQDSINVADRGGRAPGADDNGTGAMSILEVFRVLLSNDVMSSGDARNTLEFHWYAGEEAGLLGSRDLFAEYNRSGVDVKAMLNLDMTGFVGGTLDKGKPAAIGVGQDNINPALADFVEMAVVNYCALPPVKMQCGYACSDHAAANISGFPSSYIFESEFEDMNFMLHTPFDNMSRVDFDHVLEHAKLVVAFAYELAMAQF